MSNYNSYSDYDDEDVAPRRPQRNIRFDNDDFGDDKPRRRPSRRDYDEEIDPSTYGRRDRDWADDIATRADGRLDYDDDDDSGRRRAPSRRPAASQRSQRRDDDRSSRYDGRESRSRRDPRRDDRRDSRYDDRYSRSAESERDEYYDRYPDDMPEKKDGFTRRYPVLMNVIYVTLATVALLWMLMWFLDFWTEHGQERAVPDVKGQSYAQAQNNIDISGLRYEVSDSVFDAYARPGTVVEQVPVAGARIKKGGTVYLTIVAFSPKLVTVPEFYDASVRQVRSMFEGLGIRDIHEVLVPSEYDGLVLGAKFNGASLQPGARIPVSAVITLEVGSGSAYYAETDSAAYDEQAIDAAIEELNIE